MISMGNGAIANLIIGLSETPSATLMGLVAIYTVSFIIYKPTSQRLLRKQHLLTHSVVTACYKSFMVWSLFTVVGSLLVRAILEHFNALERWPNILDSDILSFLLILLNCFFTHNIKRAILIGGHSISGTNKKSIKKMIYFAHISLLLWATCLVGMLIMRNDSVMVQSLEEDGGVTLFYKLLNVWALWCAVGMLSILVYLVYLFTTYYILGPQQSQRVLEKTILKVLFPPLLGCIVGLAFTYTVDTIFRETDLSKYYGAVVSVSFFYFLWRLISASEKQVLNGRLTTIAPNKTMVQGMGNLGRGLLAICSILTIWSAFSGKSKGDTTSETAEASLS